MRCVLLFTASLVVVVLLHTACTAAHSYDSPISPSYTAPRDCSMCDKGWSGGDPLDVKVVNMSGCGLKKIPESVAKFRNARVVDVSHNQLRGLPVSFTQLAKVEYLDMSYNNVVYIPKLLDMMNVRSLVISHNKVQSLLQLPALVHLDASYNEVKGVGNLPKSLVYLDVSHNAVGALPPRFASVSALEALDVSYNHLRGLPDNSVAWPHSLRHLDVSHNSIVSLPNTLSQLDLHEFVLCGNPLHTLPLGIAKMRHLKVLDVTGVPLLKLPHNINDFNPELSLVGWEGPDPDAVAEQQRRRSARLAREAAERGQSGSTGRGHDEL